MYLIEDNLGETQAMRRMILLLQRIMMDDRLTGREIRILLAVLSLAGLNNQRVPVPIDDICCLTGILYANVCATIRRLDSLGWVSRIRGNGRGNVSLIALRIS